MADYDYLRDFITSLSYAEQTTGMAGNLTAKNWANSQKAARHLA